MNSNSIKLNGKFEIEQPLEIDKSYEVKVRVGINSVGKYSGEDGSYEYVFNAKPEFGEVLGDHGPIKMRKKGSQSQKLRADILTRGEDYELTMTGIIDHLDEILDLIKG